MAKVVSKEKTLNVATKNVQKFRKVHKGRNRGIAGGTEVSFGTFGLKAVGRGRFNRSSKLKRLVVQ